MRQVFQETVKHGAILRLVWQLQVGVDITSLQVRQEIPKKQGKHMTLTNKESKINRKLNDK